MIMRIKRTGFFVGLLVLLSGCAKTEEETGTHLNSRFSTEKPVPIGYVLSAAELDVLAAGIPSVSGSAATKANPPGIKEILPFDAYMQALQPHTRSAPSGTADPFATQDIYVVNYDDNRGFAILSADNRLPRVLAYSENGNLTDTLDNPGVQIFLDALPGYAAHRIEEVEQQLSTLSYDSLDDPGDQYYYLNRQIAWKDMETGQVGPFLQTQWGQGRPFSNHAPAGCSGNIGGHMVASCVETALAQIMTYNCHPCYPSIINVPGRGPVFISWATLAAKSRYNKFLYPYDTTGTWAVACLFEAIGKAVQTVYGCNGSSSNITKADAAIRSFGYATEGVKAYNLNTIVQNLDRRPARPVYVRGDAGNGSNGHAWVIDGYQYVIQQEAIVWEVYDAGMNFIGYEYVLNGTYRTVYFSVHCNWGWNGSHDGFFYSGAFVPGNYNLTYSNYMIANIRPN